MVSAQGSSRRELLAAAQRYATISRRSFVAADLSTIHLNHLWLDRCSFVGADLRHATLDHCHFKMCDLRTCKMRGASLRGADFAACDLRGADLRDCDLTGTNFGRVLTGADNNELTDLRDVQWSADTWVKATFDGAIGAPANRS